MHTKVLGFCKAPLSKQCVEGHNIKSMCHLVHTKSNMIPLKAHKYNFQCANNYKTSLLVSGFVC